jgi:hypothetical protein
MEKEKKTDQTPHSIQQVVVWSSGTTTEVTRNSGIASVVVPPYA